MANTDMEKLVSLCKRRGFVFQSSEIYGGINGFWDYGPLGVEMRQNIRRLWWKRTVHDRDDVVGQDASIVCHPRVWEASGHVAHFSDPMVDCKECKKRFRADHVEGKSCPECSGELTEARQFNLMFKTFVGANEEASSVAYLRPETCQPIFANFKLLHTVSRKKVPFGVAQMGKAFRNEITPRNFIFRSREFEQMEMEYFVNPKESQKWFAHWVEARRQWFIDLGINEKKIRLRPHEKDELAHYAQSCSDVEYEFYFGWQELEGIADRSSFDLSQHSKVSGKDLSYFDEETQEKFIPAVIETSVGLDRTFLVLLTDAYDEEEVQDGDRVEKRVVLRLSPHVAPYELAIFPLSKKLSEPALQMEKDLRKDFRTFFDIAGSIGKRYRRVDEIGAPFALTYDFQSGEDEAVTVRDRDSMTQDRIAISQLKDYLRKKIGSF
jgi:glycyl-tRNA synthetase